LYHQNPIKVLPLRSQTTSHQMSTEHQAADISVRMIYNDIRYLMFFSITQSIRCIKVTMKSF